MAFVKRAKTPWGSAPDPEVFKAWGKLKNSKRAGSPKAPQTNISILSSPIWLSLDRVLLSRAQLRFTRPLVPG